MTNYKFNPSEPSSLAIEIDATHQLIEKIEYDKDLVDECNYLLHKLSQMLEKATVDELFSLAWLTTNNELCKIACENSVTNEQELPTPVYHKYTVLLIQEHLEEIEDWHDSHVKQTTIANLIEWLDECEQYLKEFES
jgi:hypothetical protein